MEERVEIEDEIRLHARPASMIVDEANNYEADVNIINQGQKINIKNIKSIIEIMNLDISQADEVIIRTNGEDEEEALARIVELIENDFADL